MSTKTNSPFGRMSVKKIAKIRSVVTTYLEWRHEYRAGRAGKLGIMSYTFGVGSDSLSNNVSYVMFGRTADWVRNHTTREQREANDLEDLRRYDRAAYEVAMLRRELAAAS